MTRNRVRLAERYNRAPFGDDLSQYTAAQIAVIVAVLAEDAEQSPEARKKKKTLKDQPRVSRKTMLELARKSNPGARDVKNKDG